MKGYLSWPCLLPPLNLLDLEHHQTTAAKTLRINLYPILEQVKQHQCAARQQTDTDINLRIKDKSGIVIYIPKGIIMMNSND
jgi:hypothetical protein